MIRFLLPFAVLCSIHVQAQKTQPPVDYKMALGFSPLAALNDDNVIMLNGEYRLTENKAVTLDAGYIFSSYHFNDIKQASGVVIRPAFRKYLNKRNDFYFQFQGFFKTVTYKIEDWLDKGVVNNVATYQEFKTFKFRRNVGGVNFTLGTMQPLIRDIAYIDLYLGFGLRYRKSHLVDEPHSAYGRQSMVFPDQHVLPSLPAGIKFLFVIK